ncbi:IS701 family transposase [Sinorhizobium meliloti]|uniref:IS701 family transposase n=1 Tax=Rhizobium meliloti TaxID=382 RepID=UPI0002861BD6|nr:probabable transposase for insertion sequence element IS701 [Sinorhizobium meliloti Rm41]
MQHLRTLFLDGLLGDERRKTGWMRAEAAGDPGPWRQQAILGRGRWDADGLRDIVREYVVENLATDDAVLVIDETGFLKQGKTSCGVARQYTGSAGKITNCQIGVFAAYVSVRGHASIDRALYLPKSWTGDPARLAAAHVPEATAFATKPGLAVEVIRRALAANVPFSWVAADAVYGVGDVEGTLRRACKGYVLGVKSTTISAPGRGSLRSPAQHRRSPAISIQVHGSVFPPVRAPKARGFMTGRTANSPISMPTNTARRNRGFGPVAS